MEEKVKQIITDQLAVNKYDVTPEALLIDDLGAGSLDLLELVMALEEAFDIDIPDEDAKRFVTVGDVVKYVEGKAKERK